MSEKVLVLGGGGMLGHKLWQGLQLSVDAWCTVRDRRGLPPELFDGPRVVEGVDACAFETIERAVETARPTAVVNCIGVVKQLVAAKDPVASITINALLPHRVHRLCRDRGARFIHISTDCVYFGDRGGYVEDERPDAVDLYGRSKLLGEVAGDGGLTLRTSIIGRELRSASGLVEWFLSQRGRKVNGFRRAIFSGVTTEVLSDLILRIVTRHPEIEGLYHASAAPISKLDLVTALNRAFRAGATVEPSDALVIDRSLNGRRLTDAIGWVAPSWNEMVERLAADPTPYEDWRHRVS